ncbi:MAG: hypothetical protein AAF609_25615, partial [Cyanobacteria bacterium P01_C01_bin.120]
MRKLLPNNQRNHQAVTNYSNSCQHIRAGVSDRHCAKDKPIRVVQPNNHPLKYEVCVQCLRVMMSSAALELTDPLKGIFKDTAQRLQ